MIGPWLILFLGGLVHLLFLQGYSLHSTGSWLILLPVGFMFGVHLMKRALPGFFTPLTARICGLLGFLSALLLARDLYLREWDTQAFRPGLLVAGAGIGSLLAGMGSNEEEGGPGPWLWVAFWMLAGFLDPVLPLLGAALAGLLHAWRILPGTAPLSGPPLPRPALCLFLLGLALPKPWWDFGPRGDWAFAGLAFGLGAALVQWPPLRSKADALPSKALPWALGLFAVLYLPAFQVIWGGLLGVAAGLVWPRLSRPLPLESLGGAFLGGMVLSFALHANAWLPGLRHLIWLGN